MPLKEPCQDRPAVIGWRVFGGRVPIAKPPWMNWGHQREAENRFGYAERSGLQPVFQQPREGISAHERP